MLTENLHYNAKKLRILVHFGELEKAWDVLNNLTRDINKKEKILIDFRFNRLFQEEKR